MCLSRKRGRFQKTKLKSLVSTLTMPLVSRISVDKSYQSLMYNICLCGSYCGSAPQDWVRAPGRITPYCASTGLMKLIVFIISYPYIWSVDKHIHLSGDLVMARVSVRDLRFCVNYYVTSTIWEPHRMARATVCECVLINTNKYTYNKHMYTYVYTCIYIHAYTHKYI